MNRWHLIALLLCSFAHAALLAAADPRPLPPAPEGVVIEQNVSYLAPDRAEKLDLYLPAGRNKSVRSPAVVIIHGGGWSGGEKSALREFNVGTTAGSSSRWRIRSPSKSSGSGAGKGCL